MYDIAHAYKYAVYRQDMTEEQYTSLIDALNKLLDAGVTSQVITSEMLKAINEGRKFKWKTMSTMNSGNLLTSGTRYYHRKLLVMNSPSVVNHDVNAGTFTSQQDEYFLEPKASYTMPELLEFFYEKTEANRDIFNPRRMSGFIRTLINSFGIDITLFLIDAVSRIESKHGDKFTLDGITDNVSTAQAFLSDVKQNCSDSGGDCYVIRKRVPPM